MAHFPATESSPRVTSRAATAVLPALTGVRMQLEDARRAVWQGSVPLALRRVAAARDMLAGPGLVLEHALALSDDADLRDLAVGYRGLQARLARDVRADGSEALSTPERSSYALQALLTRARAVEVAARALVR